MKFRLYDSPKYADRYTVVYTNPCGVSPRGPVYGYRGMSAYPCHPQGIGMWGDSDVLPIDRPRSKHLGKRIPYGAAPKEVQALIWHDLLDLEPPK